MAGIQLRCLNTFGKYGTNRYTSSLIKLRFYGPVNALGPYQAGQFTEPLFLASLSPLSS